MRHFIPRHLRRAVLISFLVLALSGLTASLAFAATGGWTFTDGLADGWTLTGYAVSASAGCGGHCLTSPTGAASADGLSPAITGATSLSILNGTFQEAAFDASPTFAVKVRTGATDGAAAAISCSGGVCTYGPLTVPTSGTFQLHVIQTSNCAAGDCVVSIGNIQYTTSAPPAPTISFPSLDLTAVSTQMGGFFAFIAPALWVAVGISLGGYIAAKVRGIL